MLVADKNMEFAVRGLLNRHQSLGISPPSLDLYQHPHRDTGCLREAHTFLQPFSLRHAHAMVLLDHDGCGKEQTDRTELEAEIENRLTQTGWEDRAAAIVIAPELETWVWSDSPHVARELGWKGTPQELQAWLQTRGFISDPQQIKPPRPKEAVESVMRHAGKARSSALFTALARQVSLNKCLDPSFLKFRAKLLEWFPAHSETT
ncbi:MAG: methylation-associated defense system protein MAD4 [Blastocatellia bacterium]